MKYVSRIAGVAARKEFDKVPKFYFYFNQQVAAFDQHNPVMALAAPPALMSLCWHDLK